MLKQGFKQIEQDAARWMKEGNVPGMAIAVTSRQELLKLFTFGRADTASGTPVRPDTRFEIGSLGKPFTSIALLQLRDEGKLDLHQPVSHYLPWFAVRSKYPPITVHHLMNHTAGIIRGTEVASHGLYECWALRNYEPIVPPGNYFCYSSLGYKVLGFLLEEVAGESYGDVLRARVLEPLGMSLTDAVITPESRKTTATGHCGFYDDRPEHRSHAVVASAWEEFGTGDGSLVSTAEDMTKYLRMLLNRGRWLGHRIISEESFDMMTLDGIWTGGDFYGYGLATYDEGEYRYIGHGGGNAGFRSAIVVDMEAGLGVVILLNRMGETDPVVAVAQHALTILRAAQCGVKPPAPLPSAMPSRIVTASDYAGTYRSEEREFRIKVSGGKLLLRYNSIDVGLEPRGNDRFYAPHADFDRFLIEFVRHEGKVVEAFHGSHWYPNQHHVDHEPRDAPAEWAAYEGHYRTRNPELSNFRVVVRKGTLTLIIPWGDSQPLHPLGKRKFRISNDSLHPETLQFEAIVQGRALRVDYSGCPYYRTFAA